ncbi:hypothetical protein JOC54_002757 [Alkalihalobacillus xiaoxiensis]|uniref:Lipoprotein n=1 Tax=Shouchella xiaoxiensis TaxID=766895 RepID=A0ABS2SVD7_9BACI|nr:hypothetical protein [Shouchella xiaoxiensis]MBM7839477.1 hypothetical protein [Shouchella xiaoxiensis]
MKKMYVYTAVIGLTISLAACNTDNEANGDSTPSESASDQEHETNEVDTEPEAELDETEEAETENGEETEESNDTNETDEAGETDTDNEAEKVAGNYLIEVDFKANEAEEYETVFGLTRTTDDLTYEERIIQSLRANDPSHDELLTEMELEVEGDILNLHYDSDNLIYSLAQMPGSDFMSAISNTGQMFGLSEGHFYDNGEQRVRLGEIQIDSGITEFSPVAPTRGYYYFEVAEGEGPYFIRGSDTEERVQDDNEELLSFAETIEEMATVAEQDHYESVMYEGLMVEEASLTDDVATVQYTVESEGTEEERIRFEQGVQLTAIEFSAKELRLVNNTEGMTSVFPLQE